MPHYPDEIEYSEKYSDDVYEYRHVILPKALAKKLYSTFANKSNDNNNNVNNGQNNNNSNNNSSKTVLLSEDQWRSLGVQQSRGWTHYECHRPEPHILLFRRPLGTNPLTGLVDQPVPTDQAQQQQQQAVVGQNGGPGQGGQVQGEVNNMPQV